MCTLLCSDLCFVDQVILQTQSSSLHACLGSRANQPTGHLGLTISGVGGGIASAADDEAGANPASLMRVLLKSGNTCSEESFSSSVCPSDTPPCSFCSMLLAVVLTFYILVASESLFRYIKVKPRRF